MIETIEIWIMELGSMEFWISLLDHFVSLGYLAPILLAMVESLIPALPLVAIVTFNVTAHGPFIGFVTSWFGSVCGCFIVFCFFRYFVKRFLFHKLHENPTYKKAIEWVSKANQQILFTLALLPFTPSAFLNMAFGLSDFDACTYFITLAIAKLGMMASLAIFGTSLVHSLENPVYLVLAIVFYLVLFLFSSYLTKKHGLKK